MSASLVSATKHATSSLTESWMARVSLGALLDANYVVAAGSGEIVSLGS